MPAAAPSNKSIRTSIYGWNRKRSSSPVSIPSTSSSNASTSSSSASYSSHTFASSSSSRAPVAPLQVPPLPSHHATSIPTMAPVMATPTRRPEEGPYHEEDYQEEITRYMTAMDNATLASAELMDMQPELQWFMRPYLIDFLIEVHQQFRLRPEVLYLAMNIVDRYVSKRVVYKKHYQLVGCAALWIASKFEDGKDKVPLVRELADMCCKAYDESAFIQMEGHVLSTIQWCIGHPSAESWLRINVSGVNYEEPKVQNVARFLMEITLFHREFVGTQSSLIAQGALLLARYICNKPRRSTSRSENILVRIAMAIDKHFAEKMEGVSEIVIKKYAPTYYSRASTIVREWYLSGRRFIYNPAEPMTPAHTHIPPTGLAPSGSWSSKRSSWMSGSPSTGSISCASSDAGDEAPLTPITPVHAHVADPFTVHSHSKENIAPSGSNGSIVIPGGAGKVQVMQGGGGGNVFQQVIRPVLHAIPGVGASELAIPARSMRRLSN